MSNQNTNSPRNFLYPLFFLVIGILIGIAGTLLFTQLFPSLSPVSPAVIVTTIFSPEEGMEVVDFIGSATTTLDIEVYTFSSEDALNAVLSAHERGVAVRVIMEKDIASTTNQKTFDKILAAGIPIRWASNEFTLTHSKFIIVDGKRVLVGSHNLSKNALTKNREASVIITGPSVQDFINIFENDWSLK
jgi:phosphatidylserine/phosphatidylglycerophosphate/cardiolipin synthase-like enzyme